MRIVSQFISIHLFSSVLTQHVQLIDLFRIVSVSDLIAVHQYIMPALPDFYHHRGRDHQLSPYISQFGQLHGGHVQLYLPLTAAVSPKGANRLVRAQQRTCLPFVSIPTSNNAKFTHQT